MKQDERGKSVSKVDSSRGRVASDAQTTFAEDIARIAHLRAEAAIEAAGGDFTARIVWIGPGALVYYFCKLAIVGSLGTVVLANCAAWPFEERQAVRTTDIWTVNATEIQHIRNSSDVAGDGWQQPPPISSSGFLQPCEVHPSWIPHLPSIVAGCVAWTILSIALSYVDTVLFNGSFVSQCRFSVIASFQALGVEVLHGLSLPAGGFVVFAVAFVSFVIILFTLVGSYRPLDVEEEVAFRASLHEAQSGRRRGNISEVHDSKRGARFQEFPAVQAETAPAAPRSSASVVPSSAGVAGGASGSGSDTKPGQAADRQLSSSGVTLRIGQRGQGSVEQNFEADASSLVAGGGFRPAMAPYVLAGEGAAVLPPVDILGPFWRGLNRKEAKPEEQHHIEGVHGAPSPLDLGEDIEVQSVASTASRSSGGTSTGGQDSSGSRGRDGMRSGAGAAAASSMAARRRSDASSNSEETREDATSIGQRSRPVEVGSNCGLGLTLLQRARPLSEQRRVNSAVWAAWTLQQRRGSFMLQAVDVAAAAAAASVVGSIRGSSGILRSMKEAPSSRSESTAGENACMPRVSSMPPTQLALHDKSNITAPQNLGMEQNPADSRAIQAAVNMLDLMESDQVGSQGTASGGKVSAASLQGSTGGTGGHSIEAAGPNGPWSPRGALRAFQSSGEHSAASVPRYVPGAAGTKTSASLATTTAALSRVESAVILAGAKRQLQRRSSYGGTVKDVGDLGPKMAALARLERRLMQLAGRRRRASDGGSALGQAALAQLLAAEKLEKLRANGSDTIRQTGRTRVFGASWQSVDGNSTAKQVQPASMQRPDAPSRTTAENSKGSAATTGRVLTRVQGSSRWSPDGAVRDLNDLGGPQGPSIGSRVNQRHASAPNAASPPFRSFPKARSSVPFQAATAGGRGNHDSSGRMSAATGGEDSLNAGDSVRQPPTAWATPEVNSRRKLSHGVPGRDKPAACPHTLLRTGDLEGESRQPDEAVVFDNDDTRDNEHTNMTSGTDDGPGSCSACTAICGRVVPVVAWLAAFLREYDAVSDFSTVSLLQPSSVVGALYAVLSCLGLLLMLTQFPLQFSAKYRPSHKRLLSRSKTVGLVLLDLPMLVLDGLLLSGSAAGAAAMESNVETRESLDDSAAVDARMFQGQALVYFVFSLCVKVIEVGLQAWVLGADEESDVRVCLAAYERGEVVELCVGKTRSSCQAAATVLRWCSCGICCGNDGIDSHTGTARKQETT